MKDETLNNQLPANNANVLLADVKTAKGRCIAKWEKRIEKAKAGMLIKYQLFMNKLKECSTCHELPKLHIRHFGRTMTDPTIVPHFMYQCDLCTEKYMNIEGTCHQTFEWHTEESAIEEWNGIVDNNNSWYTKEYQQDHPLQTALF